MSAGVSIEGANIEIERFDELGYLIMPNLIERGRAHELWSALNDMPGAFSPGGQRLVNERELLRDKRFFDVVTDTNFVNVARALVGEDVQALDHVAIETPPHEGYVRHWHTDFAFVGDPLLVVTANVYLQDLTDEAGPLYVVPGTHKQRRMTDNEFLLDPMEGEVKLNLPAGSAAVFHSNLLHTGSKNNTDRPRRVLFHFYGHYWMKRLDDFYKTPLPDYITSHSDPLVRQLFGVEQSSPSIHGESYNPETYG